MKIQIETAFSEAYLQRKNLNIILRQILKAGHWEMQVSVKFDVHLEMCKKYMCIMWLSFLVRNAICGALSTTKFVTYNAVYNKENFGS